MASEKLGESHYQAELLIWKINKLPFLEHHLLSHRDTEKKKLSLSQLRH